MSLTFPAREEIARLSARMLLEIKAVDFNAAQPFTYASGLKGPTYIDCRKLISYPRIRATLMDFLAATVLRDADGDGVYEMQTVFAEGLNSPYGLAYIDGAIYVANQDAVVRFAYADGQTQAGGPPETLARLPSALNHHWTKDLALSPDGTMLYASVGSNSNAAENGMEAEKGRAAIWRLDLETEQAGIFASGLRNAVGMVAGRLVTEASGNMRLDRIAEVAATGVDYISVGALTHSAPVLDLGLDVSE